MQIIDKNLICSLSHTMAGYVVAKKIKITYPATLSIVFSSGPVFVEEIYFKNNCFICNINYNNPKLREIVREIILYNKNGGWIGAHCFINPRSLASLMEKTIYLSGGQVLRFSAQI